MQNRPAFGRRGVAQHRAPAPNRVKPAPARRAPSAAFVADVAAPPAARSADPVDAELEEWKRTRKKLPLFHWRPIYFMASLCFGLASFVLPDSINTIVDYPLYALAAVSFYLGMKMRREKRDARRAAKAEAKAAELEDAAQTG